MRVELEDAVGVERDHQVQRRQQADAAREVMRAKASSGGPDIARDACVAADPAPLRHVGLHDAQRAGREHRVEVVAADVLPAGQRDRRRIGQLAPRRCRRVDANRFFEPVEAVRLGRARRVDGGTQIPLLIRVDHQRAVADRFAHAGDVTQVDLAAEPDLQLESAAPSIR